MYLSAFGTTRAKAGSAEISRKLTMVSIICQPKLPKRMDPKYVLVSSMGANARPHFFI